MAPSIKISEAKYDEKGNKYFIADAFCMFCKKQVELKHHFTEAENKKLLDYVNGVTDGYIQDELPFLSAEEREQLISGMCPACFERIFG